MLEKCQKWDDKGSVKILRVGIKKIFTKINILFENNNGTTKQHSLKSYFN